MRPYAPLGVEHNIEANHCFFAYFDIPFAIVVELRVVIEAGLYSLVPILALRSIFVLHHVFGCEWNDFLEADNEKIRQVVLIKWE